jgi:hypothetical protein
MQYFKNVELTRLYPVSEAAVRKWIEAARNGKLDLQLYEQNGKRHIANTAHNQRVIEGLVERGKKYKNSRGHKVVTPKDEFYKLFNKKQILDIISNVDIYNEIPSQYGYFDGGANYFDEYSRRLWKEEGENMLLGTIDLLHANIGNLDSMLENYDHVNVIDLGPGNCLAVKELLTHLTYDRPVLARYIAIDASKNMLNIAERNVKEWFGDKIQVEAYQRDFTSERFDDLIIDETLSNRADKTLNLMLLFGGTIANFRSPNDVFSMIRRSMGRHDLLLTTLKLDSGEARRYFDFNVENEIPKLSGNERLVLDALNIDDSFFDVEQGFDDLKCVRYIRIRFKVDVTVNFQFSDGGRDLELHKGDTILLWRAWHHNTLQFINVLNNSSLALLQASTTRDRHYLLTISEIEGGSRAGA